MEPKNGREFYWLIVKVAQACTGLDEVGAQKALALKGVVEPEETFELSTVEPKPTPLER